jgi:hypothetical protein
MHSNSWGELSQERNGWAEVVMSWLIGGEIPEVLARRTRPCRLVGLEHANGHAVGTRVRRQKRKAQTLRINHCPARYTDTAADSCRRILSPAILS